MVNRKKFKISDTSEHDKIREMIHEEIKDRFNRVYCISSLAAMVYTIIFYELIYDFIHAIAFYIIKRAWILTMDEVVISLLVVIMLFTILTAPIIIKKLAKFRKRRKKIKLKR